MFHESKGKLIILPDFITYKQLKTIKGLLISSILPMYPELYIVSLHEYEQDIYKTDGVFDFQKRYELVYGKKWDPFNK